MKKLAVVLLVIGFLTASSGLVFADWFSKASPEKTPAVPAPKKQITTKVENKTQELVAKKKAELNGTEWEITTKPMSGKAKAEKDVLTFAEGKVSSKNMEAKGFTGTNYSMRLLEDNETYTWETMQVSEKDGTAFWRGDIGSDGVMRGVVSIRNKKNVVSDYNFVSSGSKQIAPAAPAPTEPPVPQATPVAAPVTAGVQEKQ